MEPSLPELVTCKVNVRKFILISRPSRWNKRGERIVVQSPLHKISKDTSRVLVKRFNGEEDNTVCFLPRDDFERDSSDVYKRMHVSQAETSVDAHGVALFDSHSSSTLQYLRGDKFWIAIDINAEEYIYVAPVVNLRTMESGTVPIDQVCWYPRVENRIVSPKIPCQRRELWTPGGRVRSLKLAGAKQFRYFSWAICQDLSGSKATIRTVELPPKDTRGDIRYLMSSEAWERFESRQRCMMKGHLRSLPRSPVPRQERRLLPTPPASPEFEIRKNIAVGEGVESINTVAAAEIAATVIKAAAPAAIDRGVWERIYAMSASTSCGKKQYILRGNSTHLETSPITDEVANTPCTAPYDSGSMSSGSTNRDSSLLRDDSPDALPDEDLILPGLRCADGALINAAIQLSELSRPIFREDEDLVDRPDGLAFSAADPAIARDPTLIRANWEANRPIHNPKLDNLCDKNDLKCPYTTQFTCKHYHPSPSKCHFTKPPPGGLTWSYYGSSSEVYGDHEHCITRLYPYPGGAGECMLAAIPRRNHTCCIWSEDDTRGLSLTWQRAYDQSKIEQARRHRAEIFDQSALVMVEADYGSEQLWLAGDAPGLDTRCLIGDINRELVSEIGGVDLRCRGWTAGDGWARR